MRSLATREAGSEISQALPDVIAACKVAGFDLVIVETSGIGQGDAAIVPHVDVSMYVMTPEFGAASQLEKIDMLDFADFVAINKFDRKGAQDALRDVAKQYQRNREAVEQAAGRDAGVRHPGSRFNDDGVTALYQALLPRLAELGLQAQAGQAAAPVAVRHSRQRDAIVPPARSALPGRDRRHRARLHRSTRASRSSWRASGSSCRKPSACSGRQAGQARRRRGDADLADTRQARWTPDAQKLLAHVARHAAGLCRRRVRGEDPRQGNPHPRWSTPRCPAPRSARWRCRGTRTTARSCAG